MALELPSMEHSDSDSDSQGGEPSVEIRPGSIGQMKYGYGYKLAGWWCEGECDEEQTKVVETRD